MAPQLLQGSALQEFNDVISRPFREQGIAFLNAYWEEVKDQADFIFEVAYSHMRMADMHIKGISLIHKYEEGSKLNEMASLYYYEKLCKFTLHDKEGAKWRTEHYLPSRPEMLTTIKRKAQLKKVDLNFDGYLSFLEYLIEQYGDLDNPDDFIQRNRRFGGGTASPEMLKAEQALKEVSQQIREYEKRKAELEANVEKAKQSGSQVKLRMAERELASLILSTLAEKLRVALIKAEAALRIATKKMKKMAEKEQGTDNPLPAGSLFWMNKEVSVNKMKYRKPK